MIKAIAFDFGNVVAYFDHRRAARRLAESAGPAAEEAYMRLFGGAVDDDYESGRLSTAEYLAQVRHACQARSNDEELGRVCSEVFWLNREVCSLLPRLKGRYRLLLGSNTCELHAVYFTKQFEAALRYFDHFVLSYQIGARKPKPAFFEHCLRLAGCEPSECVFIDDLPANVDGARACGWHGIVYAGTPDLCRALGELGIEGVSDGC